MGNLKILTSNGNREAADLEAIWSDPQGNKWKIALNWKTSQSESGINEISISAKGHSVGLTSRLLRQLPLGELGQQKRDHDIKKGLRFESDSAQQGGHRRVAVTDLELRKVSHIYYEAKTNRISVQKHVASYFNISIPTAARRIGLAQQRGFIKNTK